MVLMLISRCARATCIPYRWKERSTGVTMSMKTQERFSKEQRTANSVNVTFVTRGWGCFPYCQVRHVDGSLFYFCVRVLHFSISPLSLSLSVCLSFSLKQTKTRLVIERSSVLVLLTYFVPILDVFTHGVLP